VTPVTPVFKCLGHPLIPGKAARPRRHSVVKMFGSSFTPYPEFPEDPNVLRQWVGGVRANDPESGSPRVDWERFQDLAR